MATNETFNVTLHTPELDTQRILGSTITKAFKDIYAKRDEWDELLVLGYRCFYLLNSKQEPRDCTELYHFLTRCDFKKEILLNVTETHVKNNSDFQAIVATNDCSQVITGFNRMNHADSLDSQITCTIEEAIEGAVGGTDSESLDEELKIAMQLENKFLNELLICKTCKRKPAALVHLPCGCLVNCKECDNPRETK
ncbi:hypothetical protein ElyMa_002586200, partial [Elysia marginata]